MSKRARTSRHEDGNSMTLKDIYSHPGNAHRTDRSSSHKYIPIGNGDSVRVTADRIEKIAMDISSCCTGSVSSFVAAILSVDPITVYTTKYGRRKLGSVMVGDASKSYFRISMWSQHAEWVNEMAIGDIVLFGNISFRKWRDEVVGNTNSSSFFRLVKSMGSMGFDGISTIGVNEKVECLSEWFKKEHGCLLGKKDYIYNEIKNIREGEMCTIVGKVMQTNTKKGLRKTSLTCLLCDDQDSRIVLILDPDSASHRIIFQTLERSIGQIYRISKVSAVQLEGTIAVKGHVHTQIEVPPAPLLREIEQRLRENMPERYVDTSISELKLRTDDILFATVRGKVKSIHVLLDHLVYEGCISCKVPIEPDKRGFLWCRECSYSKPGEWPTALFYSPWRVTITDGTGTITAHANRDIVSQFMLNIEPSTTEEGTHLCETLLQNIISDRTITVFSITVAQKEANLTSFSFEI